MTKDIFILLISCIWYNPLLCLPDPSYCPIEPVDQPAYVDEDDVRQLLKKYDEDLTFVENVGQMDSSIRFASTFAGGHVRFQASQINFAVLHKAEDETRSFVWNMSFDGAQPAVSPRGECEKSYHQNLVGLGPTPLYNEIWYDQLYAGIDLRFYSRGDGLMEHDYVVHPKADPTQIRVRHEGPDLRLDAQGNLWLETPLGPLMQGAPYVYQMVQGEETHVQSAYELHEDGSVGLTLDRYDTELPLVIDPIFWEWATVWGGAGEDGMPVIKKGANGSIYVNGTTRVTGGINVPTTPGVHIADPALAFGDNAIFISKFDADGNLIWSTLNTTTLSPRLGGFAVHEDCSYVLFQTFPGDSFLPGAITASDFDHDGVVNMTSQEAVVIQKFDPTGNVVWGQVFDGSSADFVEFGGEQDINLRVTDQCVWFRFVTFSHDLPVYNAVQPTYGGLSDLFVGKLDHAGNPVFASYLGGPSLDFSFLDVTNPSVGYGGMAANDDCMVLSVYTTMRSTFPTTLPSFTPVEPFFGFNEEGHILVKYNSDGTLAFSMSYQSAGSGGTAWQIESVDVDDACNVYVYTNTTENLPTTPGAYIETKPTPFLSTHLSKFDCDGTQLWGTYLGSFPQDRGLFMEYDDGYVYVAGQANTPGFPVTSGSAPSSPPGYFIGRFDADGNVDYVHVLDGLGTDALDAMDVDDGCLYLLGSSSGNFPVTSDPLGMTPQSGLSYAFKTDQNGQLDYSIPLGDMNSIGIDRTRASVLGCDGQLYYALAAEQGESVSLEGAPFTQNIGETDIYLGCVGLLDCPPSSDYFDTTNVISPSSVSACIEGTVPPFSGTIMQVDLIAFGADSAYNTLTGAPYSLTGEEAHYQWQSYDPVGMAWINIAGATLADFQAAPQTTNLMLRRLAFIQGEDCDTSISNTVSIQLTTDVAPMLPPDSTYFTCTSMDFQLNVTATPDISPDGYVYSWTPTLGLDPASCPDFPNCPVMTVTSTQNVIYLVEVTDTSTGCIQTEQYAVNVWTADAGPDQVSCDGLGVRIGTPHVGPGITGFSYLWTVVSGDMTTPLSCTTCAQPLVTPNMVTTYQVQITGPDGCVLTDQVLVTPTQVQAEAYLEDSVAVCLGDELVLGEPGDPGCTYHWSPVANIDDATSAQPTFKRVSLPSVNPELYQVTKTDANGCQDVDTVYILSLFADAGIDGCGPRSVGTPDMHNFPVTYQWTKIDSTGPGPITLSCTDCPQPFVTYDTMTTTVTLELCVSALGVECCDTVYLPGCLCPIPNPCVTSSVGCAIGDPRYNTMLFGKNLDTANYTYMWSANTPVDDLTNPFGQAINQVLPSDITVTLTATAKAAPMFSCSEQVDIFSGIESLPVATAMDTMTCLGQPVPIGGPATAGWSAEWFAIQGPIDSLDDPMSFNPMFNPPAPGTFIYEVVVTDVVGNRCQARDTAVIMVSEVLADAGPDGMFCGNAVIQLGTPGVPGLIYCWDDLGGALHNHKTAQPLDTIFANTTYYLTVTDAQGNCPQMDTVVWTETVPPTFSPVGGTVCLGGSIRIGADAVPGQSYQWSPTSGLSDPNIANPLASPATSTTYTVTVTDGNPGCFTEEMVVVTVLPAEDIDAGADTLVCKGEMLMLGGSIDPDAVSFLWTPSDGLDDPTSANPTVMSVDSVITYTLRVIYQSGCMQEDDVTIGPIEVVVDAGPDVLQCEGDSIKIGSMPQSGYTYTWMALPPAAPDLGIGQPNSSMTMVAPGQDATYKVTAVNPEGCMAMDTVVVTFQATVADAGADVMYCPDDGPITIGAMAEPGYVYMWTSDPPGFSSDVAMPSVQPTIPTSYFLMVSPTLVGCPSKDTVTVTPEVPADAGADGTICVGQSVTIGGSSVLPAGATVLWTANPPDASLAGQEMTLMPTISPMQNTTYTLAVTNMGATCTSTDMVSILVSPLPAVQAGMDGVVCLGACFTIGGEAPVPGTQYLWSSTPFDPSLDVTAPTQTVCPMQTTTYILTKTDGITGCSASDTVLVTVSATPAPPVDAGPDTMVCAGEFVQIGTAPLPGLEYCWSPNSPPLSPSVNVAQPTLQIPTMPAPAMYEYILTVKDTMTGCTNVDTVEIAVNRSPTVPPAPTTVTACLQSMTELCAGCTEQAGQTYRWAPSTYLDDPTKLNAIATNVLGDINYSLTIVDTANGGCMATVGVQVMLNHVVGPAVDAGADANICEDETLMLGMMAEGSVSYMWDPATGLTPDASSSQVTFTPPGVGEYAFKLIAVNDTSGCMAMDSVEVTVLPREEVFAGADQFLCTQTVMLGATPLTQSSSVGTWSIISGGGVISDVHDPMAMFAPDAIGEHTLRWTVAGADICNPGAYDEVTVIVCLAEINAGSGDTLCAVEFIDLVATIANACTGSDGTWQLLQGDGMIDDPTALSTRYFPAGLDYGNQTVIIEFTQTGICTVSDTLYYCIGEESVNCPQRVNVSCGAQIEACDVLRTDCKFNNLYEVRLTLPSGAILPNPLPSNFAGAFMIFITNTCDQAQCMIMGSVKKPESCYIEGTLDTTVYCTDPFLGLDPEGGLYPGPLAYQACTKEPVEIRYVSDWSQANFACDSDTAVQIIREWEAFGTGESRCVAFDTITVLRLPELTAENTWCAEKDTVYCGETSGVGPYMLVPDPSDPTADCDTIYFLEVTDTNADGHLEFAGVQPPGKCRLLVHVDARQTSTGCERQYKVTLEIKQDCYAAAQALQCGNVPAAGTDSGLTIQGGGGDPVYARCVFWVTDLDTVAPVAKVKTAKVEERHLLWPQRLDQDAANTHCYETGGEPVIVVPTGRHACAVHTYLPPLCVYDGWTGVKQVKASIAGLGSWVLTVREDSCDLKLADGTEVKGLCYESHAQVELPKSDGPIQVVYEVFDSCHNVGTTYAYLLVKDETRPVAVADKGVTVSLSDKKVWVGASTFDEGSWDNCGVNLLLARRADWYEACIDLCDSTDWCCVGPHGDTLWIPYLESDKHQDEVEAHYAKTLDWLANDGEACGELVYRAWQYDLMKHATLSCVDHPYQVDETYFRKHFEACLTEGGTRTSSNQGAEGYAFNKLADSTYCHDRFGLAISHRYGCDSPEADHGELTAELDAWSQIGGGWSDAVPFSCEDACGPVTVEILVMDYWCNWSTTWTRVWVEDKTPVEVVKEVVEDEQITCKIYKDSRYAYPDEIHPVSLEYIVGQAKEGEQQAYDALDDIFGGYCKAWRDPYGNYVDASGTEIDCDITFYDSVCKCTSYYDPVRVYDEHLGYVWVDSLITKCDYYQDTIDFQKGVVVVNCAENVYCEQDVWCEIDHCGQGYIFRKFKIWQGCPDEFYDEHGVADSLRHTVDTIYRHQRIWVGNECELNKYMFDVPKDTVETCEIAYGPDGNVIGAAGPESTGYAKYKFDDDCRIVGIAHSDKVFKIVGGEAACYKILRTWYFADWCGYGEPLDGQWWKNRELVTDTCVQKIIVLDNTPPTCTITGHQVNGDTILSGGTAEVGACYFDLAVSVSAEDACGVIKYYWELKDVADEDAVTVIDSDHGELSGETTDAFEITSADIPHGSYKLVVTIQDDCANESYCEYYFNVVSVKKPSPVCVTSISATLTPWDSDQDGEVDSAHAVVWAEEFNSSSTEACNDTLLEYRIELIDGMDDDTWAEDTSYIELGCSDAGSHLARLWVISHPSGTVDFCNVVLLVTSNSEFCGGTVGGQPGLISQVSDMHDVAEHQQKSRLGGEPTEPGIGGRLLGSTLAPTGFSLEQNRPNPFREQTTIGFVLPEAMKATLTVYDVTGRVLRSIKGDYTKGYQTVQLHRSSLIGHGILYYRLDAKAFTATRKMILFD